MVCPRSSSGTLIFNPIHSVLDHTLVECPQYKDLFASSSLFRPEKATAVATHPDNLTEITARAATEVAEQTNDVFSVDTPGLQLVPTLLPTPLASAYTDIKAVVGMKRILPHRP